MGRCLSAILLILLGPLVARSEITTRNVEYKADAVALEGVVVADNAVTTRRPGILVVHEQGASSANARARAAQFARLGYATFSADLFGKGVAPKDGKDAATRTKDRKLVLGRMTAALEAFAQQPQVVPKRIAVIGYGVGGTAALDLARSGADLEGAICVHGDLAAFTGTDAKKIDAPVLVLVGADDPQISLQQVGTFESEMRAGGVDWQVVRYGGAVHDFTNPQAGRDSKSGSAYDADSDRRATEAIRAFLTEVLPLAPHKAAPPAKTAAPAAAAKGIPEKVTKVLKYVDEHAAAMEGYEGGRTFGNFEKRLPQTDAKGQRIKYREWDVNPLKPGVNRGAERMITGSDGSANYTSDHYETFKKIR